MYLIKMLFYGVVFFTLLLLSIPAFAQKPTPSDCDVYARNYASNAQGSVLGGAARGGAKGAVFGAIIDGGSGAGKGAAIGAIAGGAKRSIQRHNSYEEAYNACMAGKVQW